MDFNKATKNEASTEEANGLQFLLTLEVLPLSNLKSAQFFIKTVSIKWETQYFQSLEARM